MANNKFIAAVAATTPETRLSLLAVAAGLVNIWLGLLIAVVAVWRFSRTHAFSYDKHLALFYFTPTAVVLGTLATGNSLPPDDLLRHLTAGGLGYDYRSQYPWSTVPQANLWLGFDWLLWQLQSLGLTKPFLRQWIPALSVLLQSVVLYAALKRAVPAHRANSSLFLLAGMLGLLLLTPRSQLGRPEMFVLIFAASAFLPRSWRGVGAWVLGYLLLVPFYWLGWAYAPFALLLWPARLTLIKRIALSAALVLAHLCFWQWYTGDYLGIMVWLKSTLSVQASENFDMLYGFGQIPVWAFVAVLGFAISLVKRHRYMASAGIGLLFLWLVLPNQIRYLAAIAFVSLPWVYRQLATWAAARSLRVPPLVVLIGLSIGAGMSVQGTGEQPEFKLPPTARVYSESPYATVMFSGPGIAVEPSFALGATKEPWRELRDMKKESEHCALLYRGRFTHVVEKSRKTLLECGELQEVQGPWRLWRLK